MSFSVGACATGNPIGRKPGAAESSCDPHVTMILRPVRLAPELADVSTATSSRQSSGAAMNPAGAWITEANS